MKVRKDISKPLAIIIIVSVSVLTAMAAFSNFLPTASVVESGSMQHSDNWTPGVINTGDLVFEKTVNDPVNQTITYVQGRTTGFSSYGDYGNVIFYHAPGNYTIVHRAMFYLQWNGTVPVVIGYYSQEWINITPDRIVLKDVGYSHRNLVVSLLGLSGKTGFITMGDNNLATSSLNDTVSGGYIAADQNIFGFSPISPKDVPAIANGQIPWLGLIKLNIMRMQGGWQYYNDVPHYSYAYLSLSFVGISCSIGAGLFLLSRFEKKKLRKS